MPSSATAGTIHQLLRVGKKLTIGANGILKLTPRATPPTVAEEGMIYMDTDHKLYVHNGTTWVVVGGQV